jgi:CTP:molybdopterin cytidylyltransferase MocA
MNGASQPPGAALLLAAGASRRFGGRPKALLPVAGEVALTRTARIAREEGFAPVIAVVGRHAEEIERAVTGAPNAPDQIVRHPRWSEGRTGSIQRGLSELPPDRSVLLWPVDAPLARRSTVRQLAERAGSDSLGLWFLPTFEGRGGHPVLWKAEVTSQVLRLRPDQPLRNLLPRLGAQVARVAVDDAGVTANLNTPEEYYAAVAAFERRELSWTER